MRDDVVVRCWLSHFEVCGFSVLNCFLWCQYDSCCWNIIQQQYSCVCFLRYVPVSSHLFPFYFRIQNLIQRSASEKWRSLFIEPWRRQQQRLRRNQRRPSYQPHRKVSKDREFSRACEISNANASKLMIWKSRQKLSSACFNFSNRCFMIQHNKKFRKHFECVGD